MRAVATTGFVSDASEYRVEGVASLRRARSALPNDRSHTIRPCRATAIETEGSFRESRPAEI
jgi:hypothetical protein